MRVVVCVKHVPDGAAERRIEDGRIVRGEDDVLNELDEFAIEEAVSLVEEHGGEVIALSMGPEDSEEAVLRALQMGADRGILISDEELRGSDAPSTAAILAHVVRRLSEESQVDAVFTGMASLDGMTSMFAPALAAQLSWPLLDLASSLEVAGEPPVFTIVRDADGFRDTLRAPGPVVISVTDQINEPRYPSFKTMKAARSKPLDILEADELEGLEEVGRSTVRVIRAEEVVREAGKIVTDSGDGGTRLAAYLIEQGILA